jgi:hypothetical protein
VAILLLAQFVVQRVRIYQSVSYHEIIMGYTDPICIDHYFVLIIIVLIDFIGYIVDE